jgi:hypothetical protein
VGDARKKVSAVQSPSFGEFGGGAFGFASEGVGGGEAAVVKRDARQGAAPFFEPDDRLVRRDCSRCSKGAPTVNDLFDRYLADHVKRLRKEGTAREYEGVFNKHLSTPLGHRKVADITRADIERLHGELHRKPSTANLCLAVLSAMLEKSEAWEWRPATLKSLSACRTIQNQQPGTRADRRRNGPPWPCHRLGP